MTSSVQQREPAVWRGGTQILAAAAVLAIIEHALQLWAGAPVPAVVLTGVVFAALLAAVAVACRGSAAPGRVAFTLLAAVLAELTAVYFYWVSGYVNYPGDYLLWSESDFVNDILKLRVGYPLYTDQANSESFYYTPGAQVVTYLLASFFGAGTSIPALRAIQVGYCVLAAFTGAACVRLLITIHGRSAPSPSSWGMVWVPFLLLVGTNTATNTFTPFLHNDALAQLVCAAAYYALLAYEAGGNRRWLWVMAVIPGAGYLIKQSLAVWAALYCVYLALSRRLPLWRVALFAVAAFGLIAAAAAGAYLLWGDAFLFWTFASIKGRTVPLRALEHVLDVWMVFAMGIAAAWVLARGAAFGRLLGPFAVWLMLLAAECYTSSAAWTLSHMGPATLIGAMWLMAAVTVHWPRDNGEPPAPEQWFQAAARIALAVFVLAGLGAVRVPLRPLTADAMRYFHEIEAQFAGLPPHKVLLDAGTWIYLRHGVVMKDRVCSFGDRGFAGNGDFSGIRARLAAKTYQKVLIRNLHEANFWYDSAVFPKSTGIREAILANYREVGLIRQPRPPISERDKVHSGYLLGDITILEPRTPNSATAPRP